MSVLPGTAAVEEASASSTGRRVSGYLFRHPRVRLAGLLTLPVLWLGLVYVVALVMLLVTALWTVNPLTGEITMQWTFDNIVTVFTGELYRTVALRTLGVAVAVTIIDILIATPVAFFMAKVASPRLRRWLYVAILTPLWASYLVKLYAWRSILQNDGLADWLLRPFHASSPGFGLVGLVLALAYLWLPYVILPIYTAFEQVPDSLLEASSDLGAHTLSSLHHVLLPLVFPGIVAASIFSFSLSLGDYIAVGIVGGKAQMLGNLVYTNVGTANNLPLAAAIALIPIVIIFIYLAIVRRTGALEKL